MKHILSYEEIKEKEGVYSIWRLSCEFKIGNAITIKAIAHCDIGLVQVKIKQGYHEEGSGAMCLLKNKHNLCAYELCLRNPFYPRIWCASKIKKKHQISVSDPFVVAWVQAISVFKGTT